MEKLILLPYSEEDILRIQDIVKFNESFVALLNGEIYEIGKYLGADSLSNFSAVIDRNFYTRITAIVRNTFPTGRDLSDYRWAAAVLAFLQIADVSFYPNSSLQEYASTEGGDSAVKEIEAFRIADDTDPKHWIDFALGRIDKIEAPLLASARKAESTPTPSEYETVPVQFIDNYAFMLKIALLSRENLPSVEKVIRFIDWMYADFRFGAPALLFANIYFSPSKRSKMLKGYDDRSIKNAAWDLTLAQLWRQLALKGVRKNEPVLLVTRDKALKIIASRFTAETEEEFRSLLVDPWGKRTSEGRKICEHYLRKIEDLSRDKKNGFRRMPSLHKTKEIAESLKAELVLLL